MLIYARGVKMTPPRDSGLSPDLQKEVAKANPKRLHRWFDELEREGRVVLRTSFLRTAVYALGAWVFVIFITAGFIVLPVSTWNPFAGDRGISGWMQAGMGLLFVAGLILFGFGALLWTFVFPVVRPRMVVSRWGIESIGSKPGGVFTLFSVAWADVVQLGGHFTPTRWPFPPILQVMLTARADGVRRARWVRVSARASTVVHGVNGMLRGRRRDVLAFLVHAHAAVRDAPEPEDDRG